MLPVILRFGPFYISSFGLFLSLAFVYSTFLVWRLARAWDLNEERILDLLVLVFLGSLVFSRIYFVLQNLNLFGFDLFKMVLFTKYPGLSFWGGFLGGWLTLYAFAIRFKLDFWQMADVASVGFLGGLILGNLGCFLGSCGVGIESHAFFAVTQLGYIGRRVPIQLVEAALLYLVLQNIWYKATHFHARGVVASLTLIFVGVVKIITENFKAIRGEGYIFSFILLVLGVAIFYRVSKRKLLADLKSTLVFPLDFATKKNVRDLTLQKFSKSWYNQKTAVSWKLREFKNILRRINVKSTPRNIKHY